MTLLNAHPLDAGASRALRCAARKRQGQNPKANTKSPADARHTRARTALEKLGSYLEALNAKLGPSLFSARPAARRRAR